MKNQKNQDLFLIVKIQNKNFKNISEWKNKFQKIANENYEILEIQPEEKLEMKIMSCKCRNEVLNSFFENENIKNKSLVNCSCNIKSIKLSGVVKL